MTDPFEDERRQLRWQILAIQKRYYEACQAEIEPLVKLYASLPPAPVVILNPANNLDSIRKADEP